MWEKYCITCSWRVFFKQGWNSQKTRCSLYIKKRGFWLGNLNCESTDRMKYIRIGIMAIQKLLGNFCSTWKYGQNGYWYAKINTTITTALLLNSEQFRKLSLGTFKKTKIEFLLIRINAYHDTTKKVVVCHFASRVFELEECCWIYQSEDI